jgi:hypothetical protein
MRGSERFIFKLSLLPNWTVHFTRERSGSMEELGLLLFPHVTAAMKRVTLYTATTNFLDSEYQNIWVHEQD